MEGGGGWDFITRPLGSHTHVQREGILPPAITVPQTPKIKTLLRIFFPKMKVEEKVLLLSLNAIHDLCG